MEQRYRNFLVVYFSLTGKTKLLACEIAKILNCNIEEIIDLKERRGLLGFLRSCFDAVKENFTEIKPLQISFEKYEHIIICSPIWAINLPPAVRTFVKYFSDRFKSVSFFCTMGGFGDKKVFLKFENLCSKKPVICASFKQIEITSGKYVGKLKEILKTFL